MTTPEGMIDCDICGRAEVAFADNQAPDIATIRSGDADEFRSHYGSDHDGDIMQSTSEIPAEVKLICDGCVEARLADGSLVLIGSFLP